MVAATMIELLHTATLLHDDVVDKAHSRRGFVSIHNIWNNKAAILLGDFLLSKGLLIALENNEHTLLEVQSRAVQKMSEGELRQLKTAGLFNMTEERYYQIIEEKTASLIATCCECGAVSTTDDPKIHAKMYAIGKKGGTILDDALTNKYTYEELKSAAAKYLGIKESADLNEAKFVSSYDTKVNDAETEKDVLKIYPKAKFFTGKLTHFFGELEIRGLVNLSYFLLYSMDGPDQYKVDVDVQNRLCKCTVILTREIMTKFT